MHNKKKNKNLQRVLYGIWHLLVKVTVKVKVKVKVKFTLEQATKARGGGLEV